MTRTDYPFRMQPLDDAEGGGWLIEFPDLPGCMSDGETPEEALRNGADAVRCWIAAMREAGREVPPPSRSIGKWPIDIPDFLYHRLVERAVEEGVSPDALAAGLLAGALGHLWSGPVDAPSPRSGEKVET